LLAQDMAGIMVDIAYMEDTIITITRLGIMYITIIDITADGE
jgi:hypothetical protein